ncbi:uncharacterized protein UV8b_05562 [Ustilaginoidea virens]|uniref:DUF6603 domain-containing protein n=1 Tax=Ustilaginoidea virens TaxID=1159556 RepID=A0A8E5HTF9_USTVR|nr:uncharacterized protein UV8b_05562 [Ustilaginoidea virens]QUC21319.1 hypothetical protein UV8b_05562 [Ustilaginoidea virens]
MDYQTRLGVSSYFVGLGIGDAAIHILYSTTGPAADKTVERAILMDGGGGASPFTMRPHNNINNTIKDIEDAFFDAFVITHWDHDHYEGILWFLLCDLIEQQQRNPPQDLLTRARYGGPQGNDPLSTFYAPYWAGCYQGENHQYPDLKARITRRFQTRQIQPVLPPVLYATATLDIQYGNQWFYNLLRVRAGKEQLLGRNLFERGDRPQGAVPRAGCATLTDLMNLYPAPLYGNDFPAVPQGSEQPGMFVVACNMEVVGGEIYNNVPADGHLTATNMSSICCLLVWRPSNYVSMYTAGDVHWQLEQRIASWMQYERNQPLGDKAVTVMKLSHLHLTCWISYMQSWQKNVRDDHQGANISSAREIFDRIREQYQDVCDTLESVGFSSEDVPLPYFVELISGDLQNHGNTEEHYWRNEGVRIRRHIFNSLRAEILPVLAFEFHELYLWTQSLKDYVTFTIVGAERNADYNRVQFRYSGQSVCTMEKKAWERQVIDFYHPEFVADSVPGQSHSRNDSTFSWDSMAEDIALLNLRSRDEEGIMKPQSSKPHYLVAEGVKGGGSLDPNDTTAVPRSNPLHTFIRQLPRHRIALVSRPGSDPPSSSLAGPIKVALDETDEWQLWMRTVMFARPEPRTRSEKPLIFFRASEWPLSATTPINFSMTTNIDIGDGLLVTLTCDTSTASKALGVEQSIINAMVAGVGIMPMGIDVTLTPASSWTLGRVAELMRFSHSKTITFLQNLPLEPVNASSSGQNAVWHAAGAMHQTMIDLEFKIPKEAHDKFSEWINATGLELTIVSVTVRARRSGYYRWARPQKKPQSEANKDPDGDRIENQSTMLTKGSISFTVAVTLSGYAFTMRIDIANDYVQFSLQRDVADPGESELGKLLRWAARALRNTNDQASSLGLNAKGDYEGSSWASCEHWIEAAADFLGAVRPRLIQFTIAYDSNGKMQGLSDASIILQVDLKTGVPDDKNTVVFFLTFGWNTHGASMGGRLWCAPDPDSMWDNFETALPGYEKRWHLEPVNPEKAMDHVDLKKLLGITDLPAGVPTEVTEAEIRLDGKTMTFKGALSCSYTGKEPAQVPMLKLDRLELYAERTWADKKTGTPATWQVSLGINMLLYPLAKDAAALDDGKKPASGGDDAPCQLTGEISYSSGTGKDDSTWTLTAEMVGLKVSHLAQFWPEGTVRDSAMGMLSHITVNSARLTYHFDAGDGAGGKDFAFDGAVTLGGLRLRLDFHCNSAAGWEFGAYLNRDTEDSASVGDGAATVGSILGEIAGKDSLPLIPGEVLSIPVTRPGSDEETLSFRCVFVKDAVESLDDKKPGGSIVFTASIHINAISLTMIQWRDVSWDRNVPSKRVIKVSLSELGTIKAPLVGELKQPFEQLAYMWVSDNASAKVQPKPKTGDAGAELSTHFSNLAEKSKLVAGIRKREVLLLNKVLKNPSDTLFFKSNAADPDKIKPQDFVVEAGSHFMVIAKNDKEEVVAVLDYVFARPRPPSPPKQLEYGAFADAETPSKEPAKAPLKKSAGPLSIENIGLTFDLDNNRLGIVLDATFLLGPIGLALLGFGVSAKIEAPKKTSRLGHGVSTADEVTSSGFGSVPLSSPQVTLAGLMVSFDRPPVTVAGGFVRTKMDDATYYAGGLIVGFVPWRIQAMGVYGEVPKKLGKQQVGQARKHGRSLTFGVTELSSDCEGEDAVEELNSEKPVETFTMFFVILKIEGPLFSVGFADISGLTAGVGVNTSMRLPTAETVLDFPFTKPSGTPAPSEGPLATLKSLIRPPEGVEPWFSPREGSFWIAAGLKATAFSLMAVDAVLVVTMNPSIQLGIFGVATIDVPSLVAPVKFAHAELGIACVFDPAAGAFRFDAQLSPRSYVLHESCHLTGGMAFYAWAKTGDFVLTLGGYHQAFVPPAAYPNPPRLGIDWSLSDHLRISGEAYFAVTPRMCMGGGKLNAALSLGPLTAWFDAFLDFLINFRPFKFAADGGISVGVRFSLDLWLVTIRISAEIGATLSVLGPPMAGRVHVDFWVFGFDIDFGDRDRALREGAVGMLTLDAFKELALNDTGAAKTGVPMMGDWVDVKRHGHGDDGQVGSDEDDGKKNKTSERFLFNCLAGLLPDAAPDGKGQGSNAWMATMFDDGSAVPESAWAVKAGELEFGITLAFAASAATIYDQRPTARTKELKVDIPAEQQKIFALPMKLTEKIESTVKVRICRSAKCTAFRPLNDQQRRDDRWLVKPVIKNVPKNLWGEYDPRTDPALQGNAVASLLNAPKAAGCVALVMGLTFQPPLPFISRDRVPKFNIVRDMLLRVKNEGYAWKDLDGKADKAWSPMARGEEAEQEWERVRKVWDTQETEARASSVVRLWSQRMGWKSGGDAGSQLAGCRPRGLLARFDDVVPAAPMLAVGAA